MDKEKNKPKSKNGLSLKMCEVCTNIEFLTEEKIQNTIEEHKARFVKWCYILHDKDEYTAQDEAHDPKKEEGTPKAKHWHIFLKFDDSLTTGTIAEWFGVNIGQVNKISATRYEGGALYCVHAHDRTKYQYDAREVKANFDYTELVRKDAEKQATKARKAEIVNKIQAGEIREFNMHKAISPHEFVAFKSLIDNAFEYRRRAIADEQRDKDVIFITGDAGVGKTTYAKKLAKDKGLSFCIAGASNDPLENYKGQDVLILDDLRGSSQRLEDLLKLLDNNTNSMAKSRYHNKVLECQMIIITSSQEIDNFFVNVFQDHPENITQLKRRCGTYLEMTRDEIFVSMYDETMRDYLLVAHIENPIKEVHPVEALTEEKKEARLAFLFGENIKKIEAPTITNVETSTPFLYNNIIGENERESKNTSKDLFDFF